MTKTNISAVMMTLNEAETIEETLDSAKPMLDEVILIDGGSDDGTVALAEDWADDNGLKFDVLHSSERELLLEGWGAQRRRGEALATSDYTFALDADERVVIKNEDWFEQEFIHHGFIHTRHRFSGDRERDYRLYQPEPDIDIEQERIPRWRGSVFEELRTRLGEHIDEVYIVPEAPFEVHRLRQAASATHTTRGLQRHQHSDGPHGYSRRSQKKQHYLLERAMHSPEDRYISDGYGAYYYNNQGLIKEDWMDIRDEFELPEDAHAYRTYDNRAMNNDNFKNIDLSDGEPVMSVDNQTWGGYIKEKLGI